MVACQAENNIPVVGKEQVLNRPRDALDRVDRYYEGERPANPSTSFQPVPCMHCEKAPCELVCPVAATMHSDEGLNEMIYNRCVGTRYCSNNCPYKVRQFNFLQYSDLTTPSLKLLNNPDVTVRTRGVMEKCTYCVQRINEARINARDRGPHDRRRRGGDRLPGGLPDPGDRLRRHQRPGERGVEGPKADPRNYGMLAELNTRPRTTYLAKLRNPNPELRDEAEQCRAEPRHGRLDRTRRRRARRAAGPRAGAHVRLGHRQDQLARADPARTTGGGSSGMAIGVRRW